jgi:hypothetical protein
MRFGLVIAFRLEPEDRPWVTVRGALSDEFR